MMMYNADFLIAAVVILLLVLRNFLDQKRAEDLNSRVFLFFARAFQVLCKQKKLI